LGRAKAVSANPGSVIAWGVLRRSGLPAETKLAGLISLLDLPPVASNSAPPSCPAFRCAPGTARRPTHSPASQAGRLEATRTESHGRQETSKWALRNRFSERAQSSVFTHVPVRRRKAEPLRRSAARPGATLSRRRSPTGTPLRTAHPPPVESFRVTARGSPAGLCNRAGGLPFSLPRPDVPAARWSWSWNG